jgi:hypothetical protein
MTADRPPGGKRDTFLASIPCGEHRAILVYLRETHGRRFVRFRYWHRHRTKGVWYPDTQRNGPRAFIVPLENAAEPGSALISAVRGDEPGPMPGWFAEIERRNGDRVERLRRIGAPEALLKTERRRARRRRG